MLCDCHAASETDRVLLMQALIPNFSFCPCEEFSLNTNISKWICLLILSLPVQAGTGDSNGQRAAPYRQRCCFLRAVSLLWLITFPRPAAQRKPMTWAHSLWRRPRILQHLTHFCAISETRTPKMKMVVFHCWGFSSQLLSCPFVSGNKPQVLIYLHQMYRPQTALFMI